MGLCGMYLLKVNDRVLLTLGTFVHVLRFSEHSVLHLVFLYIDSISFPRMQKKLVAAN